MPLLGPFLGWNQLLALSHKTLLRLRTFVWTLEALSDTHSCYCDIVERVFVMLECYKMRTDFVKMCLSEAPISHVAAEELPSRINNTTSVCCTLAMSRWKWHFYIYTFPTKSLQKLQFFPWIPKNANFQCEKGHERVSKGEMNASEAAELGVMSQHISCTLL